MSLYSQSSCKYDYRATMILRLEYSSNKCLKKKQVLNSFLFVQDHNDEIVCKSNVFVPLLIFSIMYMIFHASIYIDISILLENLHADKKLMIYQTSFHSYKLIDTFFSILYGNIQKI